MCLSSQKFPREIPTTSPPEIYPFQFVSNPRAAYYIDVIGVAGEGRGGAHQGENYKIGGLI